MSECWRPIPDFPGYEVSDHGRVRSHRKSGGSRHAAPRILSPSLVSGYPALCLSQYKDQSTVYVHDLVLSAFVGAKPEGLEVCHNDGTKDNNHLTNLRYDTHSSNMRQAHADGIYEPSTGRQYIRRTYMLMPSDDEILERHADHLGCSKSAMLRIILRDWNVKAGRILIDPPVGYHTNRPGEYVTAQGE